MVTGWPHLSNPADDTFFFILGVSVVLLALNTGVMLYFVFRFNRKRHPRAEEVKENVTLEIIWTVIPTMLVLVIFWVGWKGFQYMRTAPPDAMVVKVSARQWSWTFTYANGKKSTVLTVPAGRPVKLLITSEDVLHSLFIPAYRIKEDAVPGRETHLWFLPDTPGSFDLFCTEYCGVGHANMLTKVAVVPQKEFDAWIGGKPSPKAAAAPRATAKTAQHEGEREEGPAHEGAELFQAKGCIACHSIDGSKKIGPTLKGILGRHRVITTAGQEREITADAAYLRHSMLEPTADMVKGFPPIMPSQKGQLTDREIDALIEYLKTLK